MNSGKIHLIHPSLGAQYTLCQRRNYHGKVNVVSSFDSLPSDLASRICLKCFAKATAEVGKNSGA